MDSALWQRVEELFDAALAQPAGERERFLAETCGGDDDLRAEILSLLEHDGSARGDFMEPGSQISDHTAPAIERPSLVGTSVGRYTVTRRIASGGMGTVYEAEQDRPRRTIALKVMSAGVHTKSAPRRFEHEAEILARLQHPHIAQVHDAGTFEDASGAELPYFAMEFIPDARTLIDYCNEESLGTNDRLELFADVCDAVHYGHQKGIIHRDLKPGNILVDGHGQVKIIDFGIARATDSDVALTSVHTEVGQLLGTIQYMSPEQCHADPLDLDTRSDVYSLGVVLYELVCGTLPYDVRRSAIHVAARVVCEQPPARPSTVDRKLRGDLETIALTALEKDRAKRYQSAADLGRDVRRFLDREPIEAGPPKAWARAVRWVRRHPYASTACGCVVMVAVVAIATSLSIVYANLRPYTTVVTEGNRGAQVVSFAGRVLYAWESPQKDGIAACQLVRSPTAFDGRPLAVVGFTLCFDGPERGRLHVFDIGRDDDNPEWVGEVLTGELPPNVGSTGADFAPTTEMLLADVFHGNPGQEIIAVFAHASNSLRSVRVYSLEGQVLYEAWHDGAIAAIYWMPDAGLLVLAGDTATLPGQATLGEAQGVYKPVVVFTLRPELGVRHREPFNAGSQHMPSTVAWYRVLQPAEACATIRPYSLVAPPTRTFFEGSHVAVGLVALGGQNSVSWIIDAEGREVDHPRVVSDAYRVNADELPDYRSLHFGELP